MWTIYKCGKVSTIQCGKNQQTGILRQVYVLSIYVAPYSKNKYRNALPYPTIAYTAKSFKCCNPNQSGVHLYAWLVNNKGFSQENALTYDTRYETWHIHPS